MCIYLVLGNVFSIISISLVIIITSQYYEVF